MVRYSKSTGKMIGFGCGDKNPSRKKGAWCKGLTKQTDKRIKKKSDKLKGKKRPDNIKRNKNLSPKEKKRRMEKRRETIIKKYGSWQSYCRIRQTSQKGKPKKSSPRKLIGTGTSQGYAGYLLFKWLKRTRRCEICGIKEPITIHHKDRNKKNNSPDNLQILCYNCHYLEHNVGKGRLHHRKRNNK